MNDHHLLKHEDFLRPSISIGSVQNLFVMSGNYLFLSKGTFPKFDDVCFVSSEKRSFKKKLRKIAEDADTFHQEMLCGDNSLDDQM